MSLDKGEIRELYLTPEQIKNIFFLKGIDFAFDYEKRKYD